MGRSGEEGGGSKQSGCAKARERDFLAVVSALKEANPPVSEEVAGLFVLALLKEEIAFEEGYSFHFSEEMEQEFFGEVAKDRQGRFGECSGELDAFEVADQLKGKSELSGGRGRDLEREGGELRVPRGGMVGRRGQKVREDGLEDAALLLVVEV